MTIIYLKLKYCGYAYSLFERIMKNEQYVGGQRNPSSRLFCQYHSPQTSLMKSTIVAEIVKNNSNIRVIFATTALGMGVNTPFVENVIHIQPPSTMESYLQEIGRAGRSGQNAVATLYYNKSDISANKTNVNQNIKDYCVLENVCLRKFLMKYFGHKTPHQDRCCSGCHEDLKEDLVEVVPLPPKVRKILHEREEMLLEVNKVIEKMLCNPFLQMLQFNKEVISVQIMLNYENISSEAELFQLGIIDKESRSEMFSIIDHFAPLIV
jgi:superfamily II DNA or RNA helicase